MLGTKASDCKLGLFQEADVAGDLTDSKSTYGGMLCILDDHTCVPISWAFLKKDGSGRTAAQKLR